MIRFAFAFLLLLVGTAGAAPDRPLPPKEAAAPMPFVFAGKWKHSGIVYEVELLGDDGTAKAFALKNEWFPAVAWFDGKTLFVAWRDGSDAIGRFEFQDEKFVGGLGYLGEVSVDADGRFHVKPHGRWINSEIVAVKP